MADHDNAYRQLPSLAEELERILWGQDGRTMGIAERVKEWTQEWHEAGRQEGRQEGRERLQDVVLYLLEQRFGTLVSGPTRTRVLGIQDLDELTRIAKGALSAHSLRDVGLDG